MQDGNHHNIRRKRYANAQTCDIFSVGERMTPAHRT